MAARTRLVALLALGIAGCGSDQWTAYVYPSSADLTKVERHGPFESLDNCRAFAYWRLEELHATERGDYECGSNCKPHDQYGLEVCDETSR